jgi:hypothetical protein
MKILAGIITWSPIAVAFSYVIITAPSVVFTILGAFALFMIWFSAVVYWASGR